LTVDDGAAHRVVGVSRKADVAASLEVEERARESRGVFTKLARRRGVRG
jgi:hypothetical protein